MHIRQNPNKTNVNAQSSPRAKRYQTANRNIKTHDCHRLKQLERGRGNRD